MNASGIILVGLGSLLVYSWMAYPLLLRLLARRKAPPLPPADAEVPAVDILIAAHDEEPVIAARLTNIAELDYPRDRIRIFIGDDASSDRTAAIVREWSAADPRIRLLADGRRRGKAGTLKELVGWRKRSEVRGQRSEGGERRAEDGGSVLVFTDANTMFDPQAVRRLVAPLREPRVGGVCGRLVFHKPAGGVTDEGVYWRLENRLKEYESAWDSCLGANGAIYAIRPELFWDALPDNTIVDDFVIGMKVREQGYRFLFAPAAEAHEELPATVAGEWKRRVRIGAGDYQALVLCRRCLAPGFGRFAWMFWSHKVLRWFTPHLLALVAALALAQYPFATAVALGAVLLAGAAGYAGRNVRGAWIRPFQLGAYFLAMQAALAAGFVRFCRGGLAGTWERTERGRERDQRSEVSGQKKTER